PPVFGDLPSTPIVSVAAPPASLSPAVRARVLAASRSVVKIFGQAPQCSRSIEGSGFVYAAHRVLTNAHGFAVTDQVSVQASPGVDLRASVVLVDPERDVAVLNVPGLTAPALQFSAANAMSGDPALVLGYPENGPFLTRIARVRSLSMIGGSDIYGHNNVRR